MYGQEYNLFVTLVVLALTLNSAAAALLCPVEIDVPDSYREHFQYAADVSVDRVFTRTPFGDGGQPSEPEYKNVVLWLAMGTGSYPYKHEWEFDDASETLGNLHFLYMAFNGTHVCVSVDRHYNKISVDGGVKLYMECINQCFSASDYGLKDYMEVYVGNNTINGTVYNEREVLKIVNSKPNYERRITCYEDDKVYTGDVKGMNSPITSCPVGDYCLVNAWYKVQGGLPHYTVGCGAVNNDTKQCVDQGCAYNVTAGDSGSERYYQQCHHCCSFTTCNNLGKCSGTNCDFYANPDEVRQDNEVTTVSDDTSSGNIPTYSAWNLSALVVLYMIVKT